MNIFFTFFIISAIIFQSRGHTSFVLLVNLIILVPGGTPIFTNLVI